MNSALPIARLFSMLLTTILLLAGSPASASDWPEECAHTPCEEFADYRRVDFSTKPTAERLTCTLARLTPDAAAHTSVTTAITTKSDTFSSSLGLAYGEYNFSFDLAYDDSAGGSLTIIFYENNVVQDQVQDLLCPLPQSRSGIFCEEPVKDFEGLHAFNFYCQISK